MFGCFGVKTVQQSSYGKIEVSKVSIFLEIDTISSFVPPAEKTGKWDIDCTWKYELSDGTFAYEPVYRCSVCGGIMESYLRLDKPIMPDDADFPKYCPNCGARMEVEHETN